MSKMCAWCDILKPIKNFYKSKKTNDGLRYVCIDCEKSASNKSHVGEKYCNSCKKWHTENDFNHLKNKCNDCADKLKWYYRKKAEDPDFHRKIKIKRLYGLDPWEYDTILFSQGGVCAICKMAETRILQGNSTRLSVDHNHLTGQIRGLLCHNCNTALDLVEKLDWLTAALEYLERHKNFNDKS